MDCSGRIARVIVVDNASTDSSLDGIDGFEIPLVIVRNAQNHGFAVACNQGAAITSSKYLLFLNPDTRLFHGSLSAPVSFMECSQNQNVGICGIQLVDESGQITPTCARFPTLKRYAFHAMGLNRLPVLRGHTAYMAERNHSNSREVDQVMGAFFMIRRNLFEALHGFDQRFFVYFEEVDLSLRARQAGWRSFYLANAQAYHAGGGTSRQIKAARLFYSLRSRLLYGFKHFPAWQAWLLLTITALVEFASRLGHSLLKRDWGDVRNTVRGYAMLIKSMPEIIRVISR